MPLRIRGHVGHADGAAHECRPGFLRDRLNLRKIPKLPLIHLDLGDFVVEHPGSQHGEAASLRIAEHRGRYALPHDSIPLADTAEISSPGNARWSSPSQPPGS